MRQIFRKKNKEILNVGLFEYLQMVKMLNF